MSAAFGSLGLSLLAFTALGVSLSGGADRSADPVAASGIGLVDVAIAVPVFLLSAGLQP